MERNIFTYWDGQREVKADPLAVEIAFRRAAESVDVATVMQKFVGPDFLQPESEADATPKFVALGTPAEAVKLAVQRRDEAVEELIPVLCKAFGVKTIADDPAGGMTYAEIIQAFASLNEFMFNLKKNIGSNVITPPPTAATPLPTITSGNSATTTTPPAPSGSRHSPRPRGSRSPSGGFPTAT